MYIGGVSQLTLTLENVGRIPATCHLDLHDCKDFSLKLPEEFLAMLDETGQAPVMLVTDIMSGPVSSVFEVETLVCEVCRHWMATA